MNANKNFYLYFSLLLFSLSSGRETFNASINWTTNSAEPLRVKIRNSECLNCKFLDFVQISNEKNITQSIDTYYPVYYFQVIDSTNKTKICSDFFGKPFAVEENAIYVFQILIDKPNNEACSVQTLFRPTVSIYVPLYIAIGCLVGISVLYVFTKILYKRFAKTSLGYANDRIVNSEFGTVSSSYTNLMDDEHQTLTNRQNRNTRRIKSVDVLRGLSLAIMVFVNSGAGGYSILNHSVWNGLHLADIVFPCFVFVMGIAIPLSFRSMSTNFLDRTTGQRSIKLSQLLRKLLIRVCLLFFFGLVISNSSKQPLSRLRVFGVLQRFSVCYFVISLIELLYFRFNNFVYIGFNLSDQDIPIYLLFKSKFKEIFLYPIQWLIIFIFVLIWTLLTFVLPVEGCPTGYLGPGGLHDNGSYFNCTGGAAGYIDRLILGNSHLFQQPTSKAIYQSLQPYDPEGLLGCLSSCVLTYFGVVIGHILIHYPEPIKRIARFVFYAILWAATGLALCGFSWDDGLIPINKNLWSLSYVFVMGSASLIAFTFLYFLIDVYNLYSGAPFVYLGRNSIVVYLGHEILSGFFPLFTVPHQHSYLLAINIYWVAIWTIVAAIMHYKRIHINL